MNEDEIRKIAQSVYAQNQAFDSYGLSSTPISGGNIGNSSITAQKTTIDKLSAITDDMGTITAGKISVINGGNTIGLTPNGTYAIFSGTTGNPQFKVTPGGVLTATGATISGNIAVGSLDIPDAVTANSFHVNTSGDTWWGATTFGSAIASISKAGVAIFTSVTATGTINAVGGYLGAPSTVLNISTSGLDVGTTGHIAGGQTTYNTGVGFFLGYSGAYKFSIGNPAGNYLTWDGTTLSINGTLNNITGVTTSANLQASADTVESDGGAVVATKLKEIIVRMGGTITVKGDYATVDGGTCQVSIRTNGVSRATASTTGTTYLTMNNNITVNPYDLVQFYCNSTNGTGTSHVRNFRIYYDVTSLTQTTVNLD